LPATANSFISPQTIQSASVMLASAQNGSLQAPTSTVLLLTAGANGARLTRLEVLATNTQQATQVQFFRSTDLGTTKRLIRAKGFPAYTIANTNDIPILDFGYSDVSPLILGANEQIYVASAMPVNGINARAEWGDY
jgi:hypothetical protein